MPAVVQVVATGELGVLALGDPVVEREDVVLLGLLVEERLQPGQSFGIVRRDVAGL